MKQLICFILALGVCATSLQAQDEPASSPTRLHEFGLTIGANLEFGALYRLGAKPNNNNGLIRFSTLLFNGNSTKTEESELYDLNLGVKIGYEQRLALDKYLNFVYGFEFGAAYSDFAQGTGLDARTVTRTVTPSFNLVFGVNYILKDRWTFALEVLPFISYDLVFIENYEPGGVSTSNVFTFAYGLDLTNVQLSIAYRLMATKKNKSK